MGAAPRMVLWAGPKHSGKTTAAEALVERARAEGFRVAGLLAPSVHEGTCLVGFDIVNVCTGLRAPLLRRGRSQDATQVGQYVLNEAGRRVGADALSPPVTDFADLVVVDEFGPLELGGAGWREAADRLARRPAGPVLVLVVREALVEQVADLYADGRPQVLPASAPSSVRRVLKLLARRRTGQ
jgi:nucleoside-triphosphatase THEP1